MTTKKKQVDSGGPVNPVRVDFENAVKLVGPTLTLALDTISTPLVSFMEEQGFWESENFGEKLAWVHSELGEAFEGHRTDADSTNLPGFKAVEEELADAIIGILNVANYNGLRLGEAVQAKMLYNLTRPFKHGKAY